MADSYLEILPAKQLKEPVVIGRADVPIGRSDARGGLHEQVSGLIAGARRKQTGVSACSSNRAGHAR